MFNEIENICHVKAEGKNFLDKTQSLLRLSNGKMSVIGGAGGKHLFHLLRFGVTSFMTGTEALDLHGAAVQAYLAGDERRAADIYFQQILPYLQFYLDHSEELLKWMLLERGVIDCPQVLAPARRRPDERNRAPRVQQHTRPHRLAQTLARNPVTSARHQSPPAAPGGILLIRAQSTHASGPKV